ncbi:MAG: hypothetical protein G01um101493_222 [Microgenomates group bacterium Gr01-1014_93]|nr:MAG: hypothetical protein G01um101493_222 [Microgenomates group bacterium Gr01-1014_93]
MARETLITGNNEEDLNSEGEGHWVSADSLISEVERKISGRKIPLPDYYYPKPNIKIAGDQTNTNNLHEPEVGIEPTT